MLGRSSSASHTHSGTENHLEQRDEAHLRRRYQPRADGEQHKAEPDLTDPERRQPGDVVAADVAGTGEWKEGRDEDHLRETRWPAPSRRHGASG